MQITVPCETFARLSKIATAFEASRDPAYFRSIYLEHKAGRSFAVATNIKFAAIEYLGRTAQPDASVNIDCDSGLIKQCEVERSHKGTLTIDYMSALRFASVKSSFGYVHPVNAAVFTATDNPAFERWRNWLPEKMPSGRDAPMFVDAANLAVLAESSPSGLILFPEFTSSVVVVRDALVDNWLGAFIGTGELADGRIIKEMPVKMPDWVK